MFPLQVIQRRFDGFISYARDWTDYKFGFGFLASEFWIGNEKLAHLTNQKRYRLRIDLENTEGQSYHLTYDNFRIADEWDSYSLLSVDTYDEVSGKYSIALSVFELFRRLGNSNAFIPVKMTQLPAVTL